MTTFRTTAPVSDGLLQGPAEVRMPAHRRPGHTIIALRGTLNAAAAPALREHLIGLLENSGRLLVIDLGEVPSCDTAGLAVLVGIQDRAAALGVTVRLSDPGPQVMDLLQATGLGRVLIVQTGPDAQAASAA